MNIRQPTELRRDYIYFQVIQQARQAKEWTQKDLATKINEKPQVNSCYGIVFIYRRLCVFEPDFFAGAGEKAPAPGCCCVA